MVTGEYFNLVLVLIIQTFTRKYTTANDFEEYLPLRYHIVVRYIRIEASFGEGGLRLEIVECKNRGIYWILICESAVLFCIPLNQTKVTVNPFDPK